MIDVVGSGPETTADIVVGSLVVPDEVVGKLVVGVTTVQSALRGEFTNPYCEVHKGGFELSN